MPEEQMVDEEKPFPADAGFLLAAFFCVAGAYNLARALMEYPVLWPLHISAQLLLFFAPVLFIGFYFIFGSLRQRWKAGRGALGRVMDIVAFALLPMLGSVLFYLALLFYVNGVMDASEEREILSGGIVHAAFLGKKKAEENCAATVDMPATLLPLGGDIQGERRFAIYCRSLFYIQKGSSMDFFMRNGFLGVPWIENYRANLAVGGTVQPREAPWGLLFNALGLSWIIP